MDILGWTDLGCSYNKQEHTASLRVARVSLKLRLNLHYRQLILIWYLNRRGIHPQLSPPTQVTRAKSRPIQERRSKGHRWNSAHEIWHCGRKFLSGQETGSLGADSPAEGTWPWVNQLLARSPYDPFPLRIWSAMLVKYCFQRDTQNLHCCGKGGEGLSAVFHLWRRAYPHRIFRDRALQLADQSPKPVKHLLHCAKGNTSSRI